MTNLVNNNSGNNNSRSNLSDRLNQYYLEKNSWKELNGGCPISADIEGTLDLLSKKVFPKQDNLPEMVKASIVDNAEEGQTLEQIWTDKLAEGANFVGIVAGLFGFYRGEEKLQIRNKPLSISGTPLIYQLRKVEQEEMRAQIRKTVNDLKNKSVEPVFGIGGDGSDV